MAWYFSPRESAQCGLKRVKMCYKMPMQSTGKEKFTVYVYLKTQLYDQDDPWSESDSECSDDQDEESCEEEQSDVEQPSQKKISKQSDDVSKVDNSKIDGQDQGEEEDIESDQSENIQSDCLDFNTPPHKMNK